MVERFPSGKEYIELTDAHTDFGAVRSVVRVIRSLRAEKNIAPAKFIQAEVTSEKYKDQLKASSNIIKEMARLDSLKINAETGAHNREGTVGYVLPEFDIDMTIDFGSAIDPEKERERLQKEIDNVAPYVVGLEKKLKGEFAKKAPKAVVEAEEKKFAEAKEKLEKLEEQMKTLG